MTNQERPEGWTERMQPMDDPNRSSVTTVAAPRERGAQAPQAPATEQPAQEQAEMTKGEAYWYAEALKSREAYQKVAPLAPYVDVIAYLDSNTDATRVLMEHMTNNNHGSQQGNEEMNNALHGNQQAPVQPVAPAGHQAQGVTSMNDTLSQELKKQHMDLLKERGIPEYEADKYVQFLMNPDDLTPAELLDIYSGLRQSRGDPLISNGVVPQPTTPQTTEQPQAQSGQMPAPEARQSELPPMSVAGINGATEDPQLQLEVNARAGDRSVMDPNNI
jgi:hypothetical protein